MDRKREKKGLSKRDRELGRAAKAFGFNDPNAGFYAGVYINSLKSEKVSSSYRRGIKKK